MLFSIITLQVIELKLECKEFLSLLMKAKLQVLKSAFEWAHIGHLFCFGLELFDLQLFGHHLFFQVLYLLIHLDHLKCYSIRRLAYYLVDVDLCADAFCIFAKQESL